MEGYPVETSRGGDLLACQWEVEVKYKVEIAAKRTRKWLGDRIH